jgi:hypothetical protein
MSTLHAYAVDAADWLIANPIYLWGAISAALNLARHYKLLDKIEKRPWGAAVLDVVRATGLDPAGVLRVASLVASTKAAALGAGVLIPPPSDQSPPTPRDTGADP